jgi:hypothetical protein
MHDALPELLSIRVHPQRRHPLRVASGKGAPYRHVQVLRPVDLGTYCPVRAARLERALDHEIQDFPGGTEQERTQPGPELLERLAATVDRATREAHVTERRCLQVDPAVLRLD